MVAQRLTGNCEQGPRTVTRGVFIHSTRGGAATPALEYVATVNYFLRPGTQASAHLVIGPDAITRCVHDQDIAWHARENNYTHLGIELAQATAASPYTEFQYEALAVACKLWAARYGFPLERVPSQYVPGLIGHSDSEQGWRDGKSDPGDRATGGQFDWPKLLALVEEV